MVLSTAMDAIFSLWPFLVGLFAVGLVAGVVAGLFGVGGGIIIVPALFFAMGLLDVSDAVRMHVAVATSLAIIIVTSLRSVMAHYRHGAVDMPVLRTYVPWIVAGAFAGSLVARFVPGDALTGFFGAFALIISMRMAFFRDVKPMASEPPSGFAGGFIGAGMGFASSWMGIGGGVFGVILLTLTGRSIHKAVATAAGFGAAIGIPGALGFILSGWGRTDLPPLSLGYVNLAGFALISTAAALTTPLGARLAHRLSKDMLGRVFALLLGVLGSRMLWSALTG
jgi:uncharacterized protein